MPIFALYNFDETGTVAADSALGNGAQNGAYLDGATSIGGKAVLDGVDDKVKILPNEEFQMSSGTLEIQFSQDAHVGDTPNTVLSRDTLSETDGGYRIEVMPDGSVMVSHESGCDTATFQTEAGFVNSCDEINVVYSWDAAVGGTLQISNLTTDASFEADVPAGLTMDQGPINQPWIVGAGQSQSDAGMLNNLDTPFQGSVGMFSLSDTVDNAPDGPTANPDAVTTTEDTVIDVIPVLANDTETNDQALTISGTPTAENGTVGVNADGTLSYTPNRDFVGEDTITYAVRNPDGVEASSTVAVTVTPVNDAPVAVDDRDVTDLDTAVAVDLIGNDTDVDNPNADLSLTGTPTSADGTVVVNGDGRSVTFTPNDGFIGSATINYTVIDPDGLTDEGVATISVVDPTRDGIVRGTDGADLIDETYVDPIDAERVDAGDALFATDGPDDDRIRAGDGDDTVFSGLGDDTVWSGAGRDLVYGGTGDDELRGEDGGDFLYGGDGQDTVYGQEGDDFINTSGSTPLPNIDYPGYYPADTDPEDDRDLVYGGVGNDTIITGDDADTIFGDTGNDSIDAGIDADLVYGGAGDDTIIGSEGADTIFGGAGDDLIYGGLGEGVGEALDLPDDVDLRPENNPDVIFGGAGNDTIYGRDDDDSLSGGDGDDVLYGGVDNDFLSGDEGNDLLEGDEGDDTLVGGEDSDTLIGGDGADVLFGGADRDLFIVDTPAGGVTADGPREFIDGGEEGDDYDTLDLRGSGPFRIDYSADNPEDGTVNFFDEDGNPAGYLDFSNIENVIPCFTPGTLIATPKGEVPVESLTAGDRVITRDNGIQQICWTGVKKMDWGTLTANPHLRPIMIRRGSLGHGLPERDMMVSPNHRVLVSNDRTSLYFDEHEVLVAAKHLVGGKGIFEVESIGTSYIHFMFEQHEVVLSDGAWTESFQPGDYTLKGMGNAQRNEILELFPELKTKEGLEDYTAARRTLKKHEAKLLVR
ncbi:tandem-95 repeat protein (plasmid) [Pseudorhodobacter turbinis]|uniref:Tandem-95 repeat protein n=1 Tax=Pseudorhodobacter turbinis TaxID=2500533 RepID=A0A4P8EJB8_9RHOB|nr:Hint domain-containing protein [Pseudorhodobacter turbinis]QCO57068.1 tandem-95 repeat protein [Pseudorhodobacter turbinis]